MTAVADDFDVAEIEPDEDGFDVADDPENVQPDEVWVKNHRYHLPDPDGGEKRVYYTRATTFAKVAADNFKINQWSQRMVAKGLAMAPSIVAQVVFVLNEHLDPADEIKVLQPLAEQAKDTAAAREPAAHGTAVHALTEQLDRGTPGLEFPEPWDVDMLAYQKALEVAGLEVRPDLMERIVLNRRYGIAGKFDRIYRMAKPCPVCRRRYAIGDLKTGRTMEYGMNEISIQLAIYGRAELIFNYETRSWERMPALCRHQAFVVHLPVTKGTATIFRVDIMAGWQGCKISEAVRQWRNRPVAQPLWQVDVERTRLGSYKITNSPLTWEDRIDLATTVGELSEIRKEGKKRRKWTTDLEARYQDRLVVLGSV